MTSLPIAEAKNRFSEVLKVVEGGEEVFITRGSKKEAVAVIIPIEHWQKSRRRELGTLKDKLKVTFSPDWYMSDEELLGL